MRRELQRFLATEAAGGVVLVVAAAIALIWANVAPSTYTSTFDHDVHVAVNDGLMALFFLAVGLEIKRELVTGELRDRRVAALPVIAAVGGMVVPAVLFLLVDGGRGWGIPMATDIAFAVGVLALLGSRVPPAAKLFLLSLAIVDDIGAIVVIALAYSDAIHVVPLAIAVGCALASLALRRAGVHALPVHAALAVACWAATFESGVHATIAGVAFGLLTPADRGAPIERRLHPWTSFVVVPLFALANAGVQLDLDVLDGHESIAAGVVVGLVVGKPLGIVTAAWLAVRSRVAVLPEGVAWPLLVGVGAVAGIGFTVSLFVAGLAYDGDAHAAATMGVLAASIVAALAGAALTAGATAPRRRSSG